MSIGAILSAASGTWVAAANGANDNGKGVATLPLAAGIAAAMSWLWNVQALH